jgi:hypothetical protein
MSITYEQRVCEFCLQSSDVVEAGSLEEAGWTEVWDQEGVLDRCPACTVAASDGQEDR